MFPTRRIVKETRISHFRRVSDPLAGHKSVGYMRALLHPKGMAGGVGGMGQAMGGYYGAAYGPLGASMAAAAAAAAQQTAISAALTPNAQVESSVLFDTLMV
ncbi:hypothetical protein ACJJTC_003548 [Scirpophaga incertulas]